jgi:hypothetical protein
MVYFQTKNWNLGTFWRVLQCKICIGVFYGHLVYFTAIWSILRPFSLFYGHLFYFVVILYIFPRFGILYLQKAGNPGEGLHVKLFRELKD